jgi:hypothetical protein
MSDEIVVKEEVREVVEVSAPGPAGPPGQDGGEDLVEEVEAREQADAALEAAIGDAQATADAALPNGGGTLTGPLTLAGDPITNLQAATRQYVAAQIAALINGAPGALDTLKELADKLGSEETAIEALTAVVAGKLTASANFSDLADAVAARSNLGLGSAATHPASDFQPTDTDLTAIAALSTTTFGRELLELANATKGREKLGAAAAAHAAAHQLGGTDALALPQYDPFDLLPGVWGGQVATGQPPTAKRAYFVRFTVARKRIFKCIRWAVTTAGGGEDKIDCGIYVVNGAMLERLGSSGAVKITTNTVTGVKINEFTGTVTCEPGVVYYAAKSWETVTGAPQFAAVLNNNSNYGDIFGTGTLANRMQLFKAETFPLPSSVEGPFNSTVGPWLIASEI